VVEYALTIAREAAKEIESLPGAFAARIDAKILALSRDPRPPGVKKLKGEPALWRIRASDYRIIYAIDDRERVVDVVRVRHRSKAYE